MKKEFDDAFSLLSRLTKEEADLMQQVCQWSDVQRKAFVLAKGIFEDKEFEK